MEQYLMYIGGGAGALALTGVAAASAFYLASRPSSERLLWPMDAQAIIEVSNIENLPISIFFIAIDKSRMFNQ